MEYYLTIEVITKPNFFVANTNKLKKKKRNMYKLADYMSFQQKLDLKKSTNTMGV